MEVKVVWTTVSLYMIRFSIWVGDNCVEDGIHVLRAFWPPLMDCFIAGGAKVEVEE